MKNSTTIKTHQLLFVFFIIFFTSFGYAQSPKCFKMVSSSFNRINYNTIIPCGAKTITLTFRYFKLTAGSELKVYDGQDAAGTALHPGSGFTSTNVPSGSLEAYSGAMYFYFSTNGGSSNDSFEACWTSTVDTGKLVSKFEIPDTIYNGVKNTFINKSQNTHSKTDYIWEIEPDYGLVGFNKDLDFTLYTNKTYDVTLTASTCSGTDKYTKSVVVITPDYKVAFDFKAKNTKPIIDEVDTLSALYFFNFKRPNKPDRFHWVFDPDSVKFVNGTSADSAIIQVKFKKTGKYKVYLEAWNTKSPLLSYNEVTKKDYINVIEPPSPKVFLDIIAKNTKPFKGEVDTLFAVDYISGKPFRANRFRWEFIPSTVTYLNGTSSDLQTIQVQFNQKIKYSVKLTGWNNLDSTKTVNDTLKKDYIAVQTHPLPKVYVDFMAKNKEPFLGEIDTLIVFDSISGHPIKANKFKWKFAPNKVTYVNGTTSESQIIQVKFRELGNYSITLAGWNSEDSASTYNDTLKSNYINVKDPAILRVYLDFVATNLIPRIDEIDTLIAMDSISGKPYKANKFMWKFYPDNVSYLNGTSSGSQIIQVKFNATGIYTITLEGWNSADSIRTFNGIIKSDYITVAKSLSSIKILKPNNYTNIYPNPSTGKTNISYHFENTGTDILVYNSNGQLITFIKNLSQSGIQTIDLSEEPSGLYTIRITNNKRQIIEKVSLIRE